MDKHSVCSYGIYAHSDSLAGYTVVPPRAIETTRKFHNSSGNEKASKRNANTTQSVRAVQCLVLVGSINTCRAPTTPEYYNIAGAVHLNVTKRNISAAAAPIHVITSCRHRHYQCFTLTSDTRW